MNKTEKEKNSSIEQYAFLSDEPIGTEKEDVLGRAKFANALAKKILYYEATHSIVKSC